MDRKEAINALKLINLKSVHPFLSWEEMLEVRNTAIAALQEQERILKKLEELRDEPLMHCSEDYQEGHYIAAKEAIAIVRGEEE